jgi:outer membrane protein
VIADYGASGRSPRDAISTRELGLQVSLPLLDGFRREARQAEQTAVARESVVREADLRQQVAAEVDAALLELRSGLEQQTVAAERMRLAQQELSQARERFREGVAGNIEVINAQSSLIRAEDAVIDARYATAVARVNLARAVGVTQTLR